MLIKDLKEDYPLVYETALNNYDLEFAKECGFEIGLGKTLCPISQAFDWLNTSQDFEFWDFIYTENFKEAEKLCPHLFEDKISNEVPDYVECIKTDTDRFTKGKIYKIEKGSKNDYLQILSDNGKNQCKSGYPLNGNTWSFKPSTKEALDMARVNNGKTINNRDSYVANLLDARNKLVDAEEALELHKAKLEFLTSEKDSLDSEV